jgi:hypothetical protein
MGAVTQARDIKEIEGQLNRADRIAIISCNTCVRFCGTGGADKLDEMGHRLRMDGFSVTDQILVTAACVRDYIERSRLSSGITKVVALTCDGGWASIRQALPSVEVIKANETLGIMIVSPSKGVLKLMKTYRAYKDKLGNEFALLTGEPKPDKVINLEEPK